LSAQRARFALAARSLLRSHMMIEADIATRRHERGAAA
jgi:hypothetical protein